MKRLILYSLLLQTNLCLGQVIKIKTYSQKVDSLWIVSRIDSFNTYGDLVLSCEYKEGNRLPWREWRYVYDKKQKLLEKSIHSWYGGSHKLELKRTYRYHRNGLLKSEMDINEYCVEGFDEYITYRYDKDRKLKAVEHKYACDERGFSSHLNTYHYDKEGRLVHNVGTSAETGSIIFREYFEYDNTGNRVKKTRYWLRNEVEIQNVVTQYFFNDDCKLIRETSVPSNFIIDSVGHMFPRPYLSASDTDGAIPSEIYGYPSARGYEYDSSGNIIGELWYYLAKSGTFELSGKDIINYEYY